MTKTPPLTAFKDDPFIEPPLPCSLTLKSLTGETSFTCPNVSAYDSFITRANNHERTQNYCERCHNAAVSGNVDCRDCKNAGAESKSCPVIVLVSYLRNNS